MTSLFGIICTSMVASVGNSIVTESVEKNYRDMRWFNFVYMPLAGWVVICMLCLYQPFMQLWMSGVLAGSTATAGEVMAQSGVAESEALMLGWPEVVVLCLYFLCAEYG